MRRFLEKSFIIFFCLYNAYLNNLSTDLVLYFLVSWGISLCLDLIANKYVKVLIYLLFLGLTFYNSLFAYYLPVIVYNIYWDFDFFALFSIPIVLINFSVLSLAGFIISSYLSAMTKRHHFLLNENKTVRDELKEDTIYLKRYNDQLKIDKEKNIHIAILTERNRIARGIHDSIGHSISSSILQLEALKIGASDDIKASLVQTQNTLQRGMEDIRNNIHNLYNESLDLESRIEEMCNEVSGLNIHLLYSLKDELAFGLKFDILSIVEEGITNCIKHSNATDLNISLLSQAKFYSIIIKDNGSKFDNTESLYNKGIGLYNMKDLANKYKGFLNYEFNNGFKIHLTLMKE